MLELSQKPTRLARAGITIVELMFALLLIAVVVLLFNTVVSTIRRSGAAAGDLANMRLTWIAVEQFTQDHLNHGRIFFAHDRYTGPANRYGYGTLPWFILLRPYFGEDRDTRNSSVRTFISPGDPTGGGETTRFPKQGQAALRRSYSFNIRTLDPNLKTPDLPLTNSRPRRTIGNPGSFLLFCNHRAAEIDTVWVDPATTTIQIPDNWFHGGMAHFAFLDGHVEAIPVREVHPGGSRHSIFFHQLP